MSMSWQERIDNYAKETKFPIYMGVGPGNKLFGIWDMGNDYRVSSKFYGGYPAGYLKRIKALFPDKKNILHLFSGKVDLSILPGDTVDINADLNPTYVDDAQSLENVPLHKYDLILCDPPYSVEDAEHYQTSMIKRNKVMRALKGVNPGTIIVWLDQVKPMYKKDTFKVIGEIGMSKSTNHRYRVIQFFERLDL